MTVKDIIIKLMDCNLDDEFGFIFYDTAVFDVEISTSEDNAKENEVLLFSKRFAKIEE